MKTLIPYVVAFFIASPLHARIGETPAECTARYGEPFKVDKETSKLFFQKAGLMIVASFHEGKCEMLGIRKVEQDIIGNPAELTETEMEVLRNANGGDQAWREAQVISMMKVWETEDGKLLTQYDPLERFFVIATFAAKVRLEEEAKAKQKSTLDGF